MENHSVPKATLGRLPSYLEVLKQLAPEKAPYISATAIARKLSLGEVLVRKDLAAVSNSGKPKLGYSTAELIETLENTLGYNKLTEAVLVGAGRLGRALLQYDEFKKYGVKITAAFDSSKYAAGFTEKAEILPMNRFEEFCKENNICLGIITVDQSSAQDICDLMIKSGIKAIWNFAPCRLSVPDSILLQNENLALSLAHLNNQLCKLK